VKRSKRKISDIIEAFGEINRDIHCAFNVLCDFLIKCNEFKDWKKDEAGKKNTRKGYFDFDNLLKGTGNWYYLNCYGEYNKKIVGFTFVIGIEYYKNEYQEYLDFINKLDSSINPSCPMLFICGIYTPACETSEARIVDGSEWNYVDEILRFTDGWRNFDNNLSYDKWLNIEIEYEGEKEDYLINSGWYKSAKVKILPIIDISSEEKAENIILDLIDKANK